MSHHHHHAGQGAVVVDIGEDVGALVLYTDSDMVGAEIDITPIGDDARRSHVAVHTRPVPGHDPLHAAVYFELPGGTYRLWHPGGGPAGTVAVVAGRVTEVRWEDLTPG